MGYVSKLGFYPLCFLSTCSFLMAEREREESKSRDPEQLGQHMNARELPMA